MAGERTLFGRKIVPHHILNYSEQVHDILLEEIRAGRWDINDRLPGVLSLARDLGFGTKTVQIAYDRLKLEGYVKTLGYRGTYLISRSASEEKDIRRLGVLLGEEQRNDSLIRWYEHVIQKAARKRGMTPVVRVLPSGSDPQAALAQGKCFDVPTFGVLSLLPFRVPPQYHACAGTLPIVFLAPPFEDCIPRVSADVQEACSELVCRMVELGYERILFSEDSVESDPRQTQLHFEGYRAAMEEHSLPVDERFVKRSRDVHNKCAPSVAGHLRDIESQLEGGGARTAVLASSPVRAMALVEEAARHGVRIPREFGVATIGSACVGESKTTITGMLPDFDYLIECCLYALQRIEERGVQEFNMLFARMVFVPGDTLEAPGMREGEGQAGKPWRAPGKPDHVMHFR